jgi:hypothetical protein
MFPKRQISNGRIQKNVRDNGISIGFESANAAKKDRYALRPVLLIERVLLEEITV